MKQVIFFKGSNCVPCKIVEPMMDEVKEICRGDMQYVKAIDDVDWMMNFGIRTVPAVVIIDGDKEPTVLVGKQISKDKIVSLIK